MCKRVREASSSPSTFPKGSVAVNLSANHPLDRQIRYPDGPDPGVLGKGKDLTSSFTFLDRFGAPAEHGVGQAKITPALRVVGLFASHALENRSGGGQRGLRELLVAEQPSRAPDTKLTRDKSLIKTIGDAFGRNKRERLF